jgi:hypothetical protein
MKWCNIRITTLTIFLSVSLLKAQDCEVSLPSINKNYSGDCKKGLANGIGKAEGESVTYEGEFKKGLPNGEGKLEFKDGRLFKGEWKNGDVYGYGELTHSDGTVQSGYFKGTIENFRYLGEDKASLIGYKILKTERLDNATNSFVNSDPNGNSVTIKIFENNIRQITNFEILEITSGIIQLITNEGGRLSAEIVNVVFPITLGMRYILPYGTQDTTLPEGVTNLNSPRQMEFTIYEPGQWTVTITHR